LGVSVTRQKLPMEITGRKLKTKSPAKSGFFAGVNKITGQ